MNRIGTVESLHASASELTGLSDFGPPDHLEGLEVALASYDQEAGLTPAGIEAVRDDLTGILAARLFSEEGWKRYPEYADVPVERPVFIIGLPRTGTTTLHRLLTADPAHQGLQMWLGAGPQPRPPRSAWRDNPVFRQVQSGIDGFFAEHPGFQGIHHRAADEAEECWLLTRQTMTSAYFEFTGHLPTYSAWLAEQDWTESYRRHRRNLQLIGLHDADRRWVLKYSGHMMCLDALMAVYPDALVIRTHRRPGDKVMGSMCSMVGRIAAGTSTLFHGELLGRSLLGLAERGLSRFTADRAKYDPALFHDVEFADFAADPLGIVAGIYRLLGRELTDEARTAMAAVLAADDKMRSHTYDLADFGLTPQETEARLGALL
jgi:Sulfotransferase family